MTKRGCAVIVWVCLALHLQYIVHNACEYRGCMVQIYTVTTKYEMPKQYSILIETPKLSAY